MPTRAASAQSGSRRHALSNLRSLPLRVKHHEDGPGRRRTGSHFLATIGPREQERPVAAGARIV